MAPVIEKRQETTRAPWEVNLPLFRLMAGMPGDRASTDHHPDAPSFEPAPDVQSQDLQTGEGVYTPMGCSLRLTYPTFKLSTHTPATLSEVRARAETIQADHNIAPLLARVLAGRDKKPGEALERFLHPDIERDLPPPFTLKGSKKGCQILAEAFIKGWKIGQIHDFDADGTSCGELFQRMCNQVGAQLESYSPDRHTEGYGTKQRAIDHLIEKGCKVVFILDYGATDYDAIEYARSKGLKVVVIDHHEIPKGRTPPADALMDPRRPCCGYAKKRLSAVGLLSVFARDFIHFCKTSDSLFLHSYAQQLNFNELLGPVATGLIGDVTELVDEARVLTRASLEQNRLNPTPAQLAHEQLARRDKGAAEGKAFGEAPTRNSANRMLRSTDTGINPGRLVTDAFLSAGDDARKKMEFLVSTNEQRKRAEAAQVREVLKMVDAQCKYYGKMPETIFVASSTFNPGLNGIVANRIAELLNRPTCIATIFEDGSVQGSGRSVGDFNFYKAVKLVQKKHPELFDSFGGHPKALGFRLHPDSIVIFKEELEKVVSTRRAADFELPSIKSDLTTHFRYFRDGGTQITEDLELLEPCGVGNDPALFHVCRAKVLSVRTIDDRFLEAKLEQDGVIMTGYFWKSRFHPALVVDEGVPFWSDEYSPKPQADLYVDLLVRPLKSDKLRFGIGSDAVKLHIEQARISLVQPKETKPTKSQPISTPEPKPKKAKLRRAPTIRKNQTGLLLKTWREEIAPFVPESVDDLAKLGGITCLRRKPSGEPMVVYVKGQAEFLTDYFMHPGSWVARSEKGTGKTIVQSFAIAREISLGGRTLVIAPSRKACKQHARSARWMLQVTPEETEIRSGGQPDKRLVLDPRVKALFSTPGTFLEDLKAGKVKWDDFSSIIIDECQHIRGEESTGILAKAAAEVKKPLLLLSGDPAVRPSVLQLIQKELGIPKENFRGLAIQPNEIWEKPIQCVMPAQVKSESLRLALYMRSSARKVWIDLTRHLDLAKFLGEELNMDDRSVRGDWLRLVSEPVPGSGKARIRRFAVPAQQKLIEPYLEKLTSVLERAPEDGERRRALASALGNSCEVSHLAYLHTALQTEHQVTFLNSIAHELWDIRYARRDNQPKVWERRVYDRQSTVSQIFKGFLPSNSPWLRLLQCNNRIDLIKACAPDLLEPFKHFEQHQDELGPNKDPLRALKKRIFSEAENQLAQRFDFYNDMEQNLILGLRRKHRPDERIHVRSTEVFTARFMAARINYLTKGWDVRADWSAGEGQGASKDIIERFTDGRVNTLSTTSAGDEAVDIPGVTEVHLLTVPREVIAWNQVIGRANRRQNPNEPSLRAGFAWAYVVAETSDVSLWNAMQQKRKSFMKEWQAISEL